MSEKKSVGVIEYHDEKYVQEVMEKVKKCIDADVEFLSLKNHGTRVLKKYDVIYDMISPFNKYVSEIMKIYYLNGTYVMNNPFTTTLYNKILQMEKLVELGIPIPKTIFIPNVPDEGEEDFVEKPDFEEIEKSLGFPMVMKPYDGFGNHSISVINSRKELKEMWNKKKEKIQLMQEPIVPDDFYRIFCVNDGKVNFLKRRPKFVEAKEWDFNDTSKLTSDLRKQIIEQSALINKEFGYDLTTIEWSITKDGKAYVIDVNDAPNIADPVKAKEMDLHFPEELYHWLVDNISEMIVNKVDMDIFDRQKHLLKMFNSNMTSVVSKLKQLNPLNLIAH
jgi:glutathione synthase/RimK-type ligase-like ATP-grasp enzyme